MTSPDTILRVAARGDGVTADGRHAAFAAPGDLLAVRSAGAYGANGSTP